ncbi:MAG: HAD-IC family P-type ATPase [Actinobacteria bacterium]|nr:HAD-IC family P-type ATPase [Actinomycetota bacterium]
MSARQGLSEAEAARRLEARGPVEPPASSRSTGSIVRANVFTVFNVILLALGGLTLAFGDWRDALFLGIVVSNAGIGITQELRAKRALDRLAALVAPHGRVVRDGRERLLHVEELVPGDLVRLQAGDQIVADGPLVSATALALDESILTGESRPVLRGAGDPVRSGSFAVEGEGLYEVAAVGADSYAEKVAGEAREFRHPRSPLERALNRLLFVLVGVMVPLGGVLVFALWERDEGVRESVTTAVAGIVTLVPEGLILLASLTYAAAALQLARRGALAQQLNAIESLASVDVLCLDKTGTLTDASLHVLSLVPAGGASPDELAAALGRYAASAPSRNLTLEALAGAYPAPAEEPVEVVPFSSRTRWSALRLDDAGYVLGAPELFPLGPLAGQAQTEQRAGRRVLALGTTTQAFDRGTDGRPPPTVPLGLAVLAEELRPEARETVAFFLAEGVELKVLSGDSPETVASIAADAGIPLAGQVLDGRKLPEDPGELRRLALGASVIGRIAPEDKRRVVEALRDAGRYVAMVGDGVNDVPALKAARLAIAQGTGAQMAKSVADVVLVNGEFGSVPKMVAEGRKILRNIQRVTKLFVTKSVFAVFLILSIGVTPQEYPLLPRHLTLAASLAIGIPAFFLALAPSEGPWKTERFLREMARFAVPAGVAAGLGVLASYLLALNVFDLGLVEARTVATTVLIVVGLWLILALEATGGKRSAGVGILCGSLLAAYGVVLALPGLRGFFELAVPGPGAVAMALFGAGLAVGFLWLTDDRFVPRGARR